MEDIGELEFIQKCWSNDGLRSNGKPVILFTATGQQQRDERCIRVHFNCGNKYADEVGNLDGYGEMWLFRGGISNIMSLARVSEMYTVALHGGNFTVTRGNDFHEF